MTETHAQNTTEGNGLGENLEQRLYSLKPVVGSAFGEVTLKAVAFDYFQLAERLGVPQETASVLLSTSEDLIVYKKQFETGHERNVLLVDKNDALAGLKIKDDDVWKEYVLVPWAREGIGLYAEAHHDDFVGDKRIRMRLVKVHGVEYVLLDGMEKEIEKGKKEEKKQGNIHSSYVDLDDSTLVGLAKEDDRSAWHELYLRHQGHVFGYLSSLLRNKEAAEDIVQEAFLRAYEHIDTYTQDSSFFTWVTSIAKNLAIDFFRHQEVKHRYVTALFIDEALLFQSHGDMSGHNGYDTASKTDLTAAVQDALGHISDTSREILHLRHFEDLSYLEIAAQLDIPEGTVMSRLFYARRAVEKYMREKYPDLLT